MGHKYNMGTPGSSRGLKAQYDEWREATLAPFDERFFRNFWLAALATHFGSVIQSVAAFWLMHEMSPRADMVGLVQTAASLPLVVFALFAGALTDSFDRRLVMLAAQGVMFAASVGLSVFAALGWLTPWQLLAFTFAVGAGGAFMMPAWSTAVRDIVAPARVPAAIALNALSFQVARSVGPAIGGALIAIGGATLAFVLNSLSYLGLFVVLLGWRRPPETHAKRPESFGRAIAAGLRYAWRSAMMRSVLTRMFLFGFCASPLQTFLVILAGESQSSSFIFGVLLGAFGFGAIVGALAITRLRASATPTQIATGGALLTALASIVVAIDALSPLRTVALFVGGAAWVAVLSSLGIIVQMLSPRWVVGRALSLQLMALTGGMALGAALWGMLAAVAGLPVAFLGAAAAMLVSIVVGRWFPLPDGVDLKPAADAAFDPGSDPP